MIIPLLHDIIIILSCTHAHTHAHTHTHTHTQHTHNTHMYTLKHTCTHTSHTHTHHTHIHTSHTACSQLDNIANIANYTRPATSYEPKVRWMGMPFIVYVLGPVQFILALWMVLEYFLINFPHFRLPEFLQAIM